MLKRLAAGCLAAMMGLVLASPATAEGDFLADRHVKAGVKCEGCHKETPPAKRVKTEQCQSCHGDYQKLAERTKDMKPNNVHANHLGDIDCRECHQGHKADKLACDECHQFKFSMPKK